jgi:predicted GIY-YIG superfamily endonuclease
MFWTYILRNPKDRFYIGHTDDLEKRIANHNRTDKISGKFTRKNGPWSLVWSEKHPNRSSATRQEREIKSWKSAKRIRSELLRSPQG